MFNVVFHYWSEKISLDPYFFHKSNTNFLNTKLPIKQLTTPATYHHNQFERFLATFFSLYWYFTTSRFKRTVSRCILYLYLYSNFVRQRGSGIFTSGHVTGTRTKIILSLPFIRKVSVYSTTSILGSTFPPFLMNRPKCHSAEQLVSSKSRIRYFIGQK